MLWLQNTVAQAPSVAAEHSETALRGGFGKTLTFGTLLWIELSSQKHCSFFRSSNSWLWCLPSSEIKPFRFFFFSVIKVASASQIGNLLPELFSNMVLLAKSDVSISSTSEGPVYTVCIFTASFRRGKASRWAEGFLSCCPWVCLCVCTSVFVSVCVHTCVCAFPCANCCVLITYL